MTLNSLSSSYLHLFKCRYCRHAFITPIFSLSPVLLPTFMFLCTVPEEVKRGYQIPGTRVTVLRHTMCMLGTEPVSSGRKASTLNHWSISPPLKKPYFNLALLLLCVYSHNDFLLNKQSTLDPVMNTFSTPGTTIGWSCWYIFILDNLIRALFIHSMNPMQLAWAHTMLPPYFV